jgi:hypothetical protein
MSFFEKLVKNTLAIGGIMLMICLFVGGTMGVGVLFFNLFNPVVGIIAAFIFMVIAVGLVVTLMDNMG